MDRQKLKKTLQERGVYAGGKCGQSLETLLEVQYMISRALVSKIVKSGKAYNHDLVNEAYEQLLGKKHLAAGDKEAFTSINGQALPEIKSVNGPSPGEGLKYEQVKGNEVQAPAAIRPSSQVTNSESDEPFFHAKTASNQVIFKNKAGIEEEEDDEFAKAFLEEAEEEEEEDNNKRMRLELE